MAILLFVLKIIGFILLGLLAFIILASGVVLFVPVRYRVLFDIREGLTKEEQSILKELKSASIRIRISWLLHLIGMKFSLEMDKPKGTARILFFKKDVLSKKQGDFENITKKNVSKANVYDTTSSKGHFVEDEDENDCFFEDSSNEESKDLKHNKSVKQNKIKNLILNIKQTVLRMKELFKKILGGVVGLKIAFEDEENKEAFGVILQQVTYLLKHYGPRKAKGQVVFGTESPDHTGLLLGVLSMMPCMYAEGFLLQPDFQSDRLYVHGDLEMKGRIRGIHLLRAFLKLWKLPKFKEFILNRK